MPVFALYNFDDATTVADDAPINGVQNGIYVNGATAAGGDLVLDGNGAFAKIFPAPQFQMPAGTLEINFTPTDTEMTGPQTVLSRDSTGENQGSYRIEVMPDGSVQITHEIEGGSSVFSTGPDFYSPGDTINVTYSWDEGAEGGGLLIENQTTGATHTDSVPPELTMDMSDQSQPWMIGADQSDSDPGGLNNLDNYFQGTVDTFSLSDTVDYHPPHGSDGYVDGTAGDDLIDTSYTGDPDGDMVDANDALLPGAVGNDDFIRAGAGDDTILAGEGNDIVTAGAGDDEISGGSGNDLLKGEAGNDTLYGGSGVDTLSGGDDRDVFIGGGSGWHVDGGEGGDDYDTLDLTGAGPLRVDYDPNNPENGLVNFLDDDGNTTSTMTFVNIEHVIPCFTPGTLIATPKGEVPVEALKAGDKVVTRDNGIQEIRWIGQKALSGQDLRLNSHLQPVLIKAHSLGNGLPEQDMLVSPNHRVLVANDRTQLYFDEHEVLVAAKHLVGSAGVHAVSSIGVSYIHFMCDRHEVVLSNGAWTESFQPGDMTLKGMGNSQRSEIFELFPELKSDAGIEAYQAARRTLKRHEAQLLVK